MCAFRQNLLPVAHSAAALKLLSESDGLSVTPLPVKLSFNTTSKTEHIGLAERCLVVDGQIPVARGALLCIHVVGGRTQG